MEFNYYKTCYNLFRIAIFSDFIILCNIEELGKNRFAWVSSLNYKALVSKLLVKWDFVK